MTDAIPQWVGIVLGSLLVVAGLVMAGIVVARSKKDGANSATVLLVIIIVVLGLLTVYGITEGLTEGLMKLIDKLPGGRP